MADSGSNEEAMKRQAPSVKFDSPSKPDPQQVSQQSNQLSSQKSIQQSTQSKIDPSRIDTKNTTVTTTRPTLDTPPEEEEEKRDGFGNSFEFVLTSLGLAVGLGNIWRFPTRAYNNGGSAFLIPYLTCAFLFGLPAVYFEFLTGQYQGKSPPVIFRRVRPILEGVGWMGVFVAALVAIYYIVIVSWISIYMINICRGHFALWSHCNNDWNNGTSCITMADQYLCKNHTKVMANSTLWNSSLPIPDKMVYFNGACQDANGTDVSTATEQYFMTYIVQPSSGMLDFGGFNWPVFAAMSVCWLLTGLGILKGAKIMGKISYVSVLVPYVLVVVLFINGVFQDGSGVGLEMYFGTPNYTKLYEQDTWTEALKQLCFSLSVGHGGLISLSSYSPKRNNIFRDALIVIIGDTTMSLVGGGAVFATLGYLAKATGQDVKDVVKSGLSLAFVVYPEAMTRMPVPWLWCFIFFLMLFLLGASTEIALVDVFCSCIYDQYPRFRNRKWIVVIAWCSVLYCIGLAGYYWFEMFDEYAAGFSSVCTVVCELLVMMYIYGFRNVRDDITEVVGHARNKFTGAIGAHSWYFTANWMVISPSIALILVGLSFVREYPYMGRHDIYPAVFDIFGWFLSFLPVIIVPIFMLLNFIRCRNRGHSYRTLFMLQKQHASYRRIAANYSKDQLALQDQLPDKEPWDEENVDLTDSESESRNAASGDVPIDDVATIDTSSTYHQVY